MIDFNALSAVGPGIMQGQQQAALLRQRQLEDQQQQMALDALVRQRTGAAWMGGGGNTDAFNAMNPQRQPGAMPAPQTALPRGTSPGGTAGAPPAPLAAPGVTGGMPAPQAPAQPGLQGMDGSGVDPNAPPSGAPAQQDQGGLDQYDPMQSMRMVMGLADFIQQRYKAATGQDMDPQSLMEQVDRVAALSNKFTPAQRLGMQGSIAQLRANTSSENTDKRVGAQLSVADTRAQTSSENTDKRVGASIENNKRSTSTAAAIAGGHDATSRANTGDRVAASNDRAAMVDTRQRELADAQNKLKADIAANRDTTASRNALNGAKSRLDTARIQMGQAPTETLDEGGAPAPKAKTSAALPAAAAKQLKEGVVTTFGNGQQWTLKGGKQVRVK